MPRKSEAFLFHRTRPYISMHICIFKYATFYVAFTNNKIYYVSNKRISKTNLIEDKMNREMLKEAIAEAKTIKETAIASAKAALEEAFTPQLTAMFAEKLNEMDEAEGVEETYDSMEEGDLSLEEILAELGVTEEEEMMAEGDNTEKLDEDLMLEEMSDEDIEELVTQVIDDMIASGKLMAGEESDMDDMEDMDMDDMDMDIDIEDMDDEDGTEKGEEKIEDDSTLEIDELLAEILGEEEELEEAKKAEEKKNELEEAYAAIAELRAELNEVNLLNAKLLYTNKIFKAKNLTESEKVKVLNTFDKAETVKEVKLVFETLTESLKATTVTKKNSIKESLGGASKTIAAAPKQQEQIIEVNDAFARMQRLAGLRK